MSEPIEDSDTKNDTGLAHNPYRLGPLDAIHRELRAELVRVAGWEVAWAYTSPEDEVGTIRDTVGVADLSPLGKLLVRGDAAQESITDALSVASLDPGYAAPIVAGDRIGMTASDSYLARLTADEWLIVTPPGGEQAIARTIEAKSAELNLFVTVVNQTSGLAGLTVVGPCSQTVLRKLCALPLDPGDFPNLRVAQSSLAKVHCILVRRDLGGLPGFDLYVERPYGDYVWRSVIDAGQEFGMIPFGWGAKGLL